MRAAVALVVLATVAYPFVVWFGMTRFEPRWLALLLLVLSIVLTSWLGWDKQGLAVVLILTALAILFKSRLQAFASRHAGDHYHLSDRSLNTLTVLDRKSVV